MNPLTHSIQPFNRRPTYLSKRPRPGVISQANMALLAFATAFFPRVLAGLGLPALVNFFHFVTIPLACSLVLTKARFRQLGHLRLVQSILLGLGILLAVMTASALLNGAGVINVFLDFLLLSEPFLFLLTLVSLPLSPLEFGKFRQQWLRFSLVNLLFALCQILVLRVDQLNPDLVKGVFISQGSGHVVGASVSMTFGVYYFATAKYHPLWVRGLILLCCLFHVVKADGKQVLAIFLSALLILIFFKAQNLKRLLLYVLTTLSFIGIIAVLSLTIMPALLTWADWGIQQEGLNLKLSGFSILKQHYHSPLNWLLGLGPGHSVGRLGGWMIWEYLDLLKPLGVTTSRASLDVWRAVGTSWLGDRSSWFSPLFGWAGIWGDLGLLGLGTYLFLWWQVWSKLCRNDLSRFFLLTILLYGTILSQLEEPGYMLYMVGVIALCWRQYHWVKMPLKFVPAASTTQASDPHCPK
jgi:hypothetical protein